MDCRRRWAVDDVRSLKWVVDDDRYQRRWAVDDDRSRIAFYQAQSKVSLDRIDKNLDRIHKTLRSIRMMRMSSATIPEHSSSSFLSSAPRKRHQSRVKCTVSERYPPLALPLTCRDPPPEYPPLELPLKWRNPLPDLEFKRDYLRSQIVDSIPPPTHTKSDYSFRPHEMDDDRKTCYSDSSSSSHDYMQLPLSPSPLVPVATSSKPSPIQLLTPTANQQPIIHTSLERSQIQVSPTLASEPEDTAADINILEEDRVFRPPRPLTTGKILRLIVFKAKANADSNNLKSVVAFYYNNMTNVSEAVDWREDYYSKLFTEPQKNRSHMVSCCSLIPECFILGFGAKAAEVFDKMLEEEIVCVADSRWADASQKWEMLFDSKLDDKMAMDHHHREKLFDPGPLNFMNSITKWKHEINSLQIFSKLEIFIHQKDQFWNLVPGSYPFHAQVMKVTGLLVPVSDLLFEELLQNGFNQASIGVMQPKTVHCTETTSLFFSNESLSRTMGNYEKRFLLLFHHIPGIKLPPCLPDFVETHPTMIATLPNCLTIASKDPQQFLLESLRVIGYSGALGNPMMASETALQRLDGTVIGEFYFENYTAYHIAAFGVDHKHLLDLYEPLLYDLMGGLLISALKYIFNGGEARFKIDFEQTHVALAFDVPGGWHDEKNATSLIVGDSSFPANGPEKGMHSRIISSCSQQVSTDFVAKAVDVAAAELQEIATPDQVTQVEPDRAKNDARSVILMDLESRAIVAEDIGRSLHVVILKFAFKVFDPGIRMTSFDGVELF